MVNVTIGFDIVVSSLSFLVRMHAFHAFVHCAIIHYFYAFVTIQNP